MANLKQSTAFTRTFLMVDSTDHVSPKTGLTVGVWLSKAGAAFTAVSGSVSEISFGWYKVALNATDTNTLGDLAFHCTGSAADLTDFNDQVTANILGDTLPANVTQWVGVAPNALISGTVDGNIHYPNPIIAVATGTVSANVIQWKGSTPNDLISGTVDAFTHYSNPIPSYPTGTVDANIVTWRSVQPNNLVSGTVDAFTHYSNPVPSFPTGTVNANLISWIGVQPNVLISGTVDGTQHYPVVQTASITGTANVNVVQWASQNVPTPDQTGVPKVNVTNWLSGSVSNPNLVGIPKVDLVDINGLATSGNNATLNLKQLNIKNISGNAIVAQSNGGDGYGITAIGNGDGGGVYIQGGSGIGKGLEIVATSRAAIFADGGTGPGMQISGGEGGIIINSTGVDAPGLYIDAAGRGVEIYGQTNDAVLLMSEGGDGNALELLGNGIGLSVYAPNGIVGDITGSITGNLYGDIHGYVGWVTGSVQNVLVSTPAAAPTGTVNANVIQWIGATPNNLISGTVDAFAHYGNFPAATITGSVDANVISWRGIQPNDLVSGTVDAFVHYANPVQAFVTGTMDANVLLWRSNQPNDLITGTVDAFSHYSNPVQANVSITGTVDANVVTWRGTQPNILISGTVDAYAHYASSDVLLSIWSYATRTLTGFGTLVADIWAAVVDSSGVTTLLSRLTAGRASNLDNLDDAISNVPTATENADALLKRDWTAITGEASRSVLNALRFIRNKFSTTAHANKVTIYKEDDTSEAYQKDVTTDATADPIVEG